MIRPLPIRTLSYIVGMRGGCIITLALLSPLLAPGQDAAPPQANPDVTFVAAPKPLPADAVTSEWPGFLGPTHDMVSPETCLAATLPPDGPPLVWSMAKGMGYGAPAIADGRLVLFHRVGGEAVVDCLDPADGRRFWRFAYPTAYRDRYGYNHGPRCSPVIAGGRVFAYGADGKLLALDLATGRLCWQHDILSEFKLQQNFFGVGATPLAADGALYVNVGADGGPCLAAFDPATGRRLWGAGERWGPSYAAPVPAVLGGRRYLLTFAGGESDPATGGLVVVDPERRAVAAEFPWRGTRYESVNASAPLALGDRVFVSECYGAGGVMLRWDPAGGLAPVWTNRDFGTHFMTAVAEDGCLYGVDGHGPGDAWLCCVDAATGQTRWRVQPKWEETLATKDGPRTRTTGTFRCWLLRVEGRALCLGEYGHLLWLDLNPDGYRELSRARLFVANDTWTPPVLSRGLLYINQNNRDPLAGTPPRLLCYDLRAGPEPRAAATPP